MAASELIATGATAATASLTLADGASATISLKAAAAGAMVVIELLSDVATYVPLGQLTQDDPAKQIAGPLTVQLRRIAGASCGVFSG